MGSRVVVDGRCVDVLVFESDDGTMESRNTFLYRHDGGVQGSSRLRARG
jgi:hypothetical protein